MRRAEDRLRGHLVESENESVRALTWGRLLETDGGGRVAIGLTDRRLLAVSTAGEFLTVRYEYVSSIRSRERTRVRYRPGDGPNRTVRLAGGLAALIALVAVAATTIGGGRALVTSAIAAATVVTAAVVQSLRTRSGVGRSAEQIAVGAGVFALLALVGTALLAGSVSVPLYALAALGGLVLAGYAATHRDELDAFGLEGHRESLLGINTVDGETVTIAVDADSTFDRELAAAVHRTEPVDVPVVRSPSNRSRDGDESVTVRST